MEISLSKTEKIVKCKMSCKVVIFLVWLGDYLFGLIWFFTFLRFFFNILYFFFLRYAFKSGLRETEYLSITSSRCFGFD